MNFEKALEAMRQGKKVRRKAWRDTEIYLSSTTLFTMICDDVFADDWEIYEEPKKEPEMTAEKASKILDLILDYINVGEFEYITHCSFSEIAESVRLAIETLENQNQPKPEKKSKCGFNCKIQPAKWFSDEKLAFDTFTAGLKFGLEIAKDSQKENKNNAG